MVDVTPFEQAGSKLNDRVRATESTAPAYAAVVQSTRDAMAAYEQLCSTAILAPHQCPAWIHNWSTHVNPDTLIVLLQDRETPVFALPVEIVRSGFSTIARFPGGSHANGNFAPGLPAFLGQAGPSGMRTLMRALRQARPDVDLVSLERQIGTQSGFGNPLLTINRAQSPDIALAVDLEGGFDALLARASGKRKRKKVRSQTRKFEAAGGFRLIQADTAEDAARLMTAFFEMKTDQFDRMGITNVFGEPPTQAFFRDLFGIAKSAHPVEFVLQGLEVDGQVRAVTGSTLQGDRMVCDFAAFADDDLAQASPGEFLFFHNIKSACEAGLRLYDFSVGDERYKRLWSPTETQVFETVVPLTAKGHALRTANVARRSLKRAAKRSPRIRAFVKRLRSRQ